MWESGRRIHHRNGLFSVCGRKKLDTWCVGKCTVDMGGQKIPPTQCARLEALYLDQRPPCGASLQDWRGKEACCPIDGGQDGCFDLGNPPLSSLEV